MAIYYVAILAKYVLDAAADEAEARRLGGIALESLRLRALIHIRTVRPATPEEIQLQRWHAEVVAAEQRGDMH